MLVIVPNQINYNILRGNISDQMEMGPRCPSCKCARCSSCGSCKCSCTACSSCRCAPCKYVEANKLVTRN